MMEDEGNDRIPSPNEEIEMDVLAQEVQIAHPVFLQEIYNSPHDKTSYKVLVHSIYVFILFCSVISICVSYQPSFNLFRIELMKHREEKTESIRHVIGKNKESLNETKEELDSWNSSVENNALLDKQNLIYNTVGMFCINLGLVRFEQSMMSSCEKKRYFVFLQIGYRLFLIGIYYVKCYVPLLSSQNFAAMSYRILTIGQTLIKSVLNVDLCIKVLKRNEELKNHGDTERFRRLCNEIQALEEHIEDRINQDVVD